MMEKILEKYKHIAVTGTGAGVGTTFIATTLAYYYAEKGMDVSYTEFGLPSDKRSFWSSVVPLSRSAVGNMRSNNMGYLDFYEIVYGGEPLSGKHNYYPVLGENGCNDGKIDFRIITKESKEKDIILNEMDMFRLAASARGDVCIYDVAADSEYDFAFRDVDILIIVCSPMPSFLISDRKRIEDLEMITRKCRRGGVRVQWIVNRFDKGVSSGKLRKIIPEKELKYVEELPKELFSASEFRNDLFAKNVEISGVMRHLFDSM